jgi:glycerol-3-phosphate acyltransferase PlsY
VRFFESCRIVIVESPLLFAFVLVAAAYLLGSFSSAIMLSRLMGFADPRSQGSRNPGATNVLRIAGKKAAALTLFGDLLKGLLPVLLARFLFDSDLIVAGVGFAAFVGHCYPLWYRFEGGKGVATAIGFLLGFDWMLGLIVVAIWLTVARVFRLSSLAALIAFATLPALHALLGGDARVTALFILLDLILIWRHRGNIRRLLRGEEPASRIKPD